jgi:kynurenine formamidase
VVDDFKTIGKRISNWHRWGDTDERGTLNWVSAEHLVAAAHLVRKGKVFDLGIPVDSDGPQPGVGQSGRINPVHLMSVIHNDFSPDRLQAADDFIFMPLQSGTQWDGLAHIGYDDKLYNGFPASEITTMDGAKILGVQHIGKGVVGRAVVLDVARFRGVPWLGRGEVVNPDELEAIEKAQGVKLGQGDILLLRTGWLAKYKQDGDKNGYFDGEPGLGLATAEWIAERRLAAVASDNWGIEVNPEEAPDEWLPLHCVLIRDLGLTLGEIFDLEELAEDCQADGVWEGFFAGPPLKVTNGVGSPVNPLVIK